MQEKSVAQILQENKAELEKTITELKQLQDAYAAKKQELEALKQELDKVKAENQVLVGEKETMGKSVAEMAKQIEDLKAQMALTPVASISEGVAIVKIQDGASGEHVDHKAILAKLSGAEKIKYYREHQKEIEGK